MAYEKPRIIDVRGRTISIAHLDLPAEPVAFLNGDIAAAATNLTVLDNNGFSQNNLILIGKLGTEQAEIKRITAAVTRGTSLVSTAVTFQHNAGDEVKRVLFNQWKIYGNTTNTTVGASLIATIDMQVDANQTDYVNTGVEYAYYFVLPYDSLNGVDGDTYSDGVSNVTGYDLRSAGYLIEQALHSAKAEKGGHITDKWLLGELNDGATDVTKSLKRWSFLQSFNYMLGQTLLGNFIFTMPSDAEDRNSNKSILDVRLNGRSLDYVDKREMSNIMRGTIYTPSRTLANPGDTTLAITNSYDFGDAGTVKVYINNVAYSITYTGITRSASTGLLTGIPATGTGSISVIIPAGTNVFQNEAEGAPWCFTVYDGVLQIGPLPSSQYSNMNLVIDYFTSRTLITSYDDILESSRYDLYKHWMIWKIRCQNSATGMLDMEDGDFKMYNRLLVQMTRRELSGQKHKMKPKVNGIFYGGTSESRAGHWRQ